MDEIVDRRDAIDTAHDLATGDGLDGRAELRLIGAKVGPGLHCQRGDQAIGIESQFGIADHRAPVGVGLKGIAAFAGPFHRPAKRAGGVKDEGIFSVDEGLHAETAADIASDDTYLLGRDLENRPR